MALRNNPKFRNLLKQRRQAARSGNQKAFSNLTNKLREARGRSPLSDAQKAKMFNRQSAKFGGQPDNRTFRGRPGGLQKGMPSRPGGLQQGMPSIKQPRAPGGQGNINSFNSTPFKPGMSIPNQGRPVQQGPNNMPGQGKPFMPTMSPQTGSTMGPQPSMEQTYTPGRGRQLQGPLAFKDGGEVESMPMGERPYKEEKGKKNSMRGVGKAVQGTKFKGVF